MKSIITYSLYLITSLAFLYSVSTTNQPNTFDFERAELKMMPNTGLKIIKFIAKKLNQTVGIFDVQFSLNRTYDSLFVHIVAYRQFSTNAYRKFLFDLWEDICKVAKETDGNVFLKIMKQLTAGNTNLYRECPFTPGIYFVTIKRIPLDRLNFGQILPSGRYRIEFTYTNGFKGTTLMIYKLYLSISDRRIEQF